MRLTIGSFGSARIRRILVVVFFTVLGSIQAFGLLAGAAFAQGGSPTITSVSAVSDPDIASALVNGGLKDVKSAPLPGSM
ncbi:MAG: hypothetical protein ACYDEY_13950 [Acidimicrobiales bacterium]